MKTSVYKVVIVIFGLSNSKCLDSDASFLFGAFNNIFKNCSDQLRRDSSKEVLLHWGTFRQKKLTLKVLLCY